MDSGLHLLAYEDHIQGHCEKTPIEICPPLVNINTNKLDDVKILTDVLYSRLKAHDKKFMIVYGDDQLVELLWSLICEEPDNFMWLVPFPGEFHFLYHITCGIYRLFAPFLLQVANLLSRLNITKDFISAHWYRQEDFLLLVVQGIYEWLQQVTGLSEDDINVDLLKTVEKNSITYYVLYFFFQYGLFYFNLRQSIRMGDVAQVQYAWKHCWSLFHVTNKYHYEKLCMMATYIENFSHAAIQETLKHRLMNLTGTYGRFMGPDMVTEKVIANISIRD